jgi:hypothetical protein
MWCQTNDNSTHQSLGKRIFFPYRDRRVGTFALYGLLTVLCLAGCEPEGDEPAEVSLPVTFNGGGLTPAVNDLGWQVTLNRFDVCVENMEFTQEGEAHASILKRVSDFFIPEAMAHPGHLAGGDVTGTLTGKWLIPFLGASRNLGLATLLEGDYNGVNLSFCVADETVGAAATSAIFGHQAMMSGTATNGISTVQFTAIIDIGDAPTMWGGVFELMVAESSSVQLVLHPFSVDPFEEDTFFDGLDFGALDDDGDGTVNLIAGMPAHNILMKSLLSHDHWSVISNNQ